MWKFSRILWHQDAEGWLEPPTTWEKMTMLPAGEAMRPTWSMIEDGVTWATVGPAGRGAIRLMVECLPDGLWEWTAWQASRPVDFQCGCRSTREAACAAAEGVAAAWPRMAARRLTG